MKPVIGKRILSALLALALAAGVAETETVLKIGDQKGNARAILEAAGALEHLAYKIEWSEFPAAAPLLEAANAGAVDAGTVGDAPFTFAVAAGVPVKAIAAVRSQPTGLAVVVRGDAPFRNFKDLVGKRIATGRGSIGHQLILALLQKEGLKPEDVHLIFLSPADAAAALSRGAIDAWSTWEPYVSQLEIGNGARIIADGAGITPGLTFFVARTDALENTGKRAALADLTGRLARARAWGLAHQDSYALTWSRIVGLPPEVGLKSIDRQRVQPVAIDNNVISDEQQTIDLYLRAGLIPKPVDAARVVDPIFNEAVIAARGTNYTYGHKE
jgi:sulfonate transport system substrate-binding protein